MWMRLSFLLFTCLSRLVIADWQPNVNVIKTTNTFWIEQFDDSSVCLRFEGTKFLRSTDNALTWTEITELNNVDLMEVSIDRFNPGNRAFAWSADMLYVTDDQGENWRSMKIPWDEKTGVDENTSTYCSVNGHPQSDNYLLVSCTHLDNGKGHRENSGRFFFYSNDGKSLSQMVPKSSQPLSDAKNYYECQFLRQDADSELGGDHDIICSEERPGAEQNDPEPETLVFTTSDFGKTMNYLEQFENMRILRVSVEGIYAVIVTAEDRFNPESPIRIWISKDGQLYEEASLPAPIRHGVYFESLGTSRNKLVAISQMIDANDKNRKQTSVLISDSTGLKFSRIPDLEYGEVGFYMFQSVDKLRGTVMCSFMGSVGHGHHMRAVVNTKISMDNGKTWSNLRVDDPDSEFKCDPRDVENCSLNLFWMNERDGMKGPPSTAGILTTIGTVGSQFDIEWKNHKTFISRDGGSSWRKVFDFPTQVVFGDYGNIAVAMPFTPEADGDETSEFFFSLDQGRTWTEHPLKEKMNAMAAYSTTFDGSGTSFVLVGAELESGQSDIKSAIYVIDFAEAFNSAKCTDSDLEEWYLNEGKCIAGAKRKIMRRKADSSCLIRSLYKDLEEVEEICDCSEEDYECAPEFVLGEDGTCIPDRDLVAKTGKCVRKSSVKLPPIVLSRGNKCRNPLEIDPIEVDCADKLSPLNAISVTANTLDWNLRFYQYFNTFDDETIILLSDKNDVHISHDNGETINKLEVDDKFIEIVFNSYNNRTAYLFGTSGKLYITRDRAISFDYVELPHARQLGFPLSFHAKDDDSFIYYGGQDCDSIFSPDCHAVAYITHDGGKTFVKLLEGAIQCDFVGSTYQSPPDPNMIMCLVKHKGQLKRSILTSTDDFKTDTRVVFDDAIGYVSVGEYTAIAVPHNNQELRAFVTLDGKEYAEGKFPADIGVDKQQAYTVLGSQTGAIFFHLTTENRNGQQFGVLMKSNSNGTSFVTLERAVNRGPQGFVDFEKLEGLEGIILINTVSNADSIRNGNREGKKLKTKITFNDGGDWQFLRPPAKDSQGKAYACKGNLNECSLNLHGYTERKDVRDTYSSGSALGMMVGVGSVGKELAPVKDCSTFITLDAGNTWREVRKGSHHWEYGDQGSIIVLVKDVEKTNYITYSIDSGKTWNDFEFSEKEVSVEDIVTTPHDSVMRFLIVAKSTSVIGQKTQLFTIDFSRVFPRQCVLDWSRPENDDYSAVKLTDCMFGHQAEYLKKISDDCFIGAAPLEKSYRIVKNCSCTRDDFECDYNYYKASDGTCKLVEGLDPAELEETCKKHPDLVEFFKPTGYRKVPLSTCVGGLNLDQASVPQPCPGKEKEFRDRHKASRSSVVVITLLPLFVFLAAMWFIYDRGIKRNGGFARFGEIRLGDEELISETRTDRAVNAIVAFGVTAYSAMSATFLLVKRGIRNAFLHSRARIQRSSNGPSYSSLTHDQFLDEADELLAGHDDDANDLVAFPDDETNFEVDDPPPQESFSDVETSNSVAREENYDEHA
ncbi:LAMI_0H13036g1_1 [Lachancea mirantina]|uniref:LAMI_0H13036g1_1 n=1 Tax=Lachancea mirantina TaxID=1230905 RepID=A0A1G4KHW5_9SACH|nr:LAMI_0H13036g1_1 [Lachancea mirantina]